MLSLRLLAAANLALCAGVLALVAAVPACEAFARARARYRDSRRRAYEDALRGALGGTDPEALAAALAPRLPGDAVVVEESLLAVLRGLRGPQGERLREAALRLGLYERHLRALRSPGRPERVRAMRALGVLRAKQAVAPLLAGFEAESLELKRLALKTLADIGDPAAVPHFVAAAYALPRVEVVPLAAMLLRFGPPGRRGVQTLVARFPASFPPRVMMEVLRQAAAGPEASA